MTDLDNKKNLQSKDLEGGALVGEPRSSMSSGFLPPPPVHSGVLSLKHKLAILILILVFGSGTGALVFMTFDLRSKMRVEAERYAVTVAGTLARLAGVSQTVIGEVETILDQQMLAQAKITAHMVAAAEKSGESQSQIRNRLKSIVKETDIDEFWITDPTGRAYLTNVDGVDFSFSSDPKEQPQAYIFYPLLKDKSVKNVAQEARIREIDDSMFKYVGTKGVDMQRIVQVGYDFEFMEDLVDRVGLNRLVEAIVRDRRVESIWVFDKKLSVLAHSSVANMEAQLFFEGTSTESALASAKGSVVKDQDPIVKDSTVGKDRTQGEEGVRGTPSEEDENIVQGVLSSSRIALSFDGGHIRVVAPILSPNSKVVLGATLIRFPTDALRQLLNQSLQKTLGFGIIALILSIIVATIVGGWLSRPILALTSSVRALYGGQLNLLPIAPFTSRKDELGTFVREFQRMAVDIHQKKEELDQLVRERTAALENAQKQMRDEVALASSFQAALLPKPPKHNRFSGYGFMRPAKEMGGDFYDIFTIDEDHLGFAIADVSGKGIPAAFFMSVSRTELRNEGITGGSPALVLERVNAKLCEENPLEMFVTVFYAILDHKNGILKYANGGHNPPYIISDPNSFHSSPPHSSDASKNTRVEQIPSKGDLVLGMIENISFHEGEVKLKPNDTLFLYTDGICEAFNLEKQEFTNRRMEEVFQAGLFKNDEDAIDQMLAAVDSHVGEAPQSDDITCLSLRWYGDSEDQSSQG